MMVRKFQIVLLWIVAALVSSSAWSAEKPPIRVGLTSSQSGEFKQLAAEFLTGIEFWVRDINERGSLLGRRIELVVYDDESSGEQTAELYERLITEDQVELLIGPFSSTLALAAAPVAARHGMPMVVEATAPVVYQQGFDNVFGIYTLASQNMVDVIRLAAERGITRLGLAHQQSDFPEAVAAGARVAAPDHGLDIVFDQAYPSGVDDLTDLVAAMVAQQPQLIIVGAYLDDSIAFMKALEQSGYSPEMIAFSGAPALAEFGDALGTAADGVIATTQWMRDGRIPGSFDFGFRFRERYGRYPAYNAAGGYSAGQVLEAAARLAGTTEAGAVKAQLAQMKFQSLLGNYRVDGDGHQIGTPIYLVQWQSGHRSLVYPAELARYPMRYPFTPWQDR